MNGRAVLIRLALCLGMVCPSAPAIATPLGRLFSLASDRQKLDAIRLSNKPSSGIKQKTIIHTATPSSQASLAQGEDDESLADKNAVRAETAEIYHEDEDEDEDDDDDDDDDDE